MWIRDSDITASSSQGENFSPKFSRFSGSSCWKNSSSDHEPWIQVNLHKLHIITGIVIQGCGNTSTGWVSAVIVQSKTSDNPFTDHIDRTTSTKVLSGNVEGRCPKLIEFDPWIYAESLRIIPVSWHENVGLRFELLGCRDGCDFSHGVTDFTIADAALTSSSVLDDEHFPREARLQPLGIQSTIKLGWRPDIRVDVEPWIQVTVFAKDFD
ncbi:Coagulation factor VIII [Holothuria leucospilota]|uniref:Coagulation factor VIII n=1 Tax=Holothuria leucospilota TaxID=206669 RepID=A0A9Q0YQ69_HOLLE|nr:Coagulation factor VIII [Holothuria leucospilota]